ncbi:hypothetical protein EMIHUDRAFT_73569 [Emiliania huxleyi CCMP1516]|uniref:DNA-directed RNA polymerase subunit n=2 Tax=Emiliania huxleyi TaxID=2903 RepID=A0A0D3I7K7_EMIH1|nr:hypothetical protein EMIHUDRAFT_62211 [Emiliania huxleyi CCMP1516]XP_005779071.1 hypothetical protein EMIHUDRAFT_73569 [Emiliania huxleyi CCMP1516]EOD07242.1 hypothetical protein EMIHUDRAFT_62211 [Emiliania huxleyi CCMP1516]EOD26642.1 hypothetical protein EMIHUDRAFT_73569 [Emiliania huxleyi CCMP1516]|mmetsp:Transcript_42621/g.141167  ORF Transcript_42621/g.141167 Transcript_42621/m.141167 type:complete len:129 (-) Transcript_42621:147-533(-)|eukprot:XP_005759671.1 hypothetical protein EMIHUDRAFT_62211 [Emiliania huxleyi CCMP1516]
MQGGPARLITDNGSASRQTPFWICPECGNMLHPKEDKASRTLKRECRHCMRLDDADSNLVHVNDMRPEGGLSEAGADTVADPTLPRASGTECNSCGHTEAVFFQAPMKSDEGMKLIFMCTKCAYRWKQ